MIGRILDGQFRLESLLGRGGMGEVYLAEQLSVERRVVIKLLNAPQFATASDEERFRFEARALAQLNHPNVVHLYTFGRTSDGLAYLAMEYVAGRTLASIVLEDGALPEAEVLNILEQLCSALQQAHRVGVIHRDLKPENVMLASDRGHSALVKVLDFGIAKLSRAERRLTRQGEIIGTPLYMAPELLCGATADERSDLYALGVIGYELLTGQVPFEAETTSELVARVLSQSAVLPHRKVPNLAVSAGIEALLMRCLAKEPDQRFQSALELRDAIAALTRPRNPVSHVRAVRALPKPRDAVLSLQMDAPATQLDHLGHEEDARAWQLIRRRSRAQLWGLLALPVALTTAVAAASWMLPEPLTSLSALAAHVAPPARVEPLTLREWLQGMPFPTGTQYLKLDKLFVDVSIPAPPAEVLTFYRAQLEQKWGGVQQDKEGFTVSDPLAPIARLVVTSAHNGSRVFITRKTPQRLKR